jgi:uncharacterized protein (TIGR03084 family)
VTTLPELLEDLDAEFVEVRSLVGSLGSHDPGWDFATPARGWAVRDQVSHLAFFDDAGRRALVEPDRFAEEAAQAVERGGDPMEEHLARGRSMDGDELLAWWDGAHAGMVRAFADADPRGRVPWYGPPMGVLSFLSARLMETWAHGQDIADGLGSRRQPTDRLRHVAHLGVRTRPFSYLARGRDLPDGRIDVDLVAPSGQRWRWEAGEDKETGENGEDGEIREDRPGPGRSAVTGPALDFCLVVTQRRHLDDTELTVSGDTALEWMSLAQAFAGPPGPGRPPRNGPT